MKKASLFYRYFLLVLILCSCSIEVTQTAEATPSPLSKATVVAPTTSSFTVTHVPITWADLHLTGKLVYLSSATENNVLMASIQLLDLTTGDIATLFRAPSGAWIYYLSISPDGKQIAMSYEPSSQPDSTSNRALYLMPLDVTAPPQPLISAPTTDDHYTQVEWSPDGKYIYYVHYNHPPEQTQFYENYEIFRMEYPNGLPEKFADRAFWPRLSADSTKLVYISLDPDSGLNELFVANVDGSNIQKINFSGSWIPDILDAPIFSPDGQTILFSAPGPSQAYQPSWLDKIMGVSVAKAHNIPSDWWSVPVEGGTPIRLTNIQDTGLFASISLDQQHLVSLSAEGIFIMDLDGSNLTQLIFDPGVHGTVSWIP